MLLGTRCIDPRRLRPAAPCLLLLPWAAHGDDADGRWGVRARSSFVP